LIFQHKRVEGFWLAEWMRQFRDKLGPAVLEAQRRFSDRRWSTDVTAVVPMDEAMARLPAELARPDGKVFIRP
jgi:NADPH:quinone reductase-like Zn-dependent oxidoreductase